jgi:PIN domain nuclease of toxin-antitoxin system
MEAIEGAGELAVAAVTWFELAWLARNERIRLTVPIRTWLRALDEQVRTIPLTPEIAETAVSLPSDFPADPADRLIYATAVELGLRLVTKDRRLLHHPNPQPVALW